MGIPTRYRAAPRATALLHALPRCLSRAACHALPTRELHASCARCLPERGIPSRLPLSLVGRLRVLGEEGLVRFTGLQAKLKTWCDVRGEFPDP